MIMRYGWYTRSCSPSFPQRSKFAKFEQLKEETRKFRSSESVGYRIGLSTREHRIELLDRDVIVFVGVMFR